MAKVDALTVWNVKIEGDVYTAFEKPIELGEVIMCCYFNIGLDSAIGISVERSRTKYRYCNKILYVLAGIVHGFTYMFSSKSLYNIKDQISTVRRKPANGHEKVLTDMSKVNSEPVSMVGMNISSVYGGMIKP